ncbi:hypothetical protein DB41_IJ00210 [Neochlamydia sp. TUME1]|uniref:hypothetical protein n=1 Tax=Neochlamydia sp. TUME1 TaxID=1478174 RepID=UPI0005837861|nr:hypothetical protein [Neochlamydia sp. TUME1]KIC74550.1 hypothetical protein DB41_IJ00210 [Neochlamydia sp. TUME1]
MINGERLAIDGFFSRGKGDGKLVDYGHKGKDKPTHLLVDDNGSPLSFEATNAEG